MNCTFDSLKNIVAYFFFVPGNKLLVTRETESDETLLSHTTGHGNLWRHRCSERRFHHFDWNGTVRGASSGATRQYVSHRRPATSTSGKKKMSNLQYVINKDKPQPSYGC